MRVVVDVHDIALKPELGVGVCLKAAFREPGLVVVGAAHIDLFLFGTLP